MTDCTLLILARNAPGIIPSWKEAARPRAGDIAVIYPAQDENAGLGCGEAMYRIHLRDVPATFNRIKQRLVRMHHSVDERTPIDDPRGSLGPDGLPVPYYPEAVVAYRR